MTDQQTAQAEQDPTATGRPTWTALPVHAFTAAPRTTQPVLFAMGDDPFGTPSLLDGDTPLF